MLKFFAVFLTCSAFCMSFSASASSGHNNTQELKKILSHYDRWEGVRYKFGGNSRKGIDCSAYMQRVFQDEFAVSLPRSTSEQMKLGSRVAKSELNTGDLVFFKTSPRQRHVGVYIGEGEFIHASTSMGVTVSSLDNQYWGERYELARRINGSDA
ncbi:NlpC/P60 family protein [Serratia fonticola]|jgi:lipoprotein Spr|nr:NlpC/P60 family protein [Serratia fonticola]ATM78134.1 hydrolase [Serratia fonticola]MBC3218351.1 C40 family peptidase [Serratia fonticola]MBC3230784.1 C40 family peptidase [Serratia fonticola]MCO7512081.1 NlpC/P60 family protein [Serratia fonticola]NBJ33422.1 hydrolase [Serratia fonticola]